MLRHSAFENELGVRGVHYFSLFRSRYGPMAKKFDFLSQFSESDLYNGHGLTVLVAVANIDPCGQAGNDDPSIVEPITLTASVA